MHSAHSQLLISSNLISFKLSLALSHFMFYTSALLSCPRSALRYSLYTFDFTVHKNQRVHVALYAWKHYIVVKLY